jgi:hypothetical protein
MAPDQALARSSAIMPHGRPAGAEGVEEAFRDVFVDEERVHCVADAIAAGLGVVDDGDGLLDVGVAIHVNLDDGLAVSDDGHGRVLPDVIDELRAATGDDDVDEVVRFEELVDVGAVGVADDLDGLAGSAGVGECTLDELAEGGVGVPRLLAAAKDAGIATLEGEDSDVDGDVRAGLVDAGDDTKRDPAAADLEAIRERAGIEHLADGVGEAGHGARVGGDRGRLEGEAVQEVRLEARFSPCFKVALVCLEERFSFQLEEVGDAEDGGVLDAGWQHSEPARRGFRESGPLADEGVVAVMKAVYRFFARLWVNSRVEPPSPSVMWMKSIDP